MRLTGTLYRLDLNRRFGTAEITRLSDGASVFMQGDDAQEIESQLDALDASLEMHGGKFDYPRALDRMLDAYDTVLKKEEKK